MSRGAQVLVLVTAVGCGLGAGVFFAFSSFVMPGLGRLAPDQAVATMQSINRTAVGPAFMSVLFGAAAACVAVAIWAARSWGERPAPYALAGALLYLVGVIGVTIAASVPLNDALEAVDPAGPAAAAGWADFLGPWKAWNLVRAAAGSGATALLCVAQITR